MSRLISYKDQDLKLKTKTTFLVLKESRDQDPKSRDYFFESREIKTESTGAVLAPPLWQEAVGA